MFRSNFQRTGFYTGGEIRQLPRIKWQTQKSLEISWRFSGLTVAEGIVCVYGSDRNLYGLDSETGRQLWAYQSDEKLYSSPVIYKGICYLCSLKLEGSLTELDLKAIDIRSGRKQWQFKLEFQPLSLLNSSVPPSPVVSEGVVYLGGTDGYLYGIDAASAELVWSFKTTKNMPLTPPALKDGNIYVASGDGYLYAVEIATEEQKWKYEIGGLNPFALSFPAIAKNLVFIIDSNNTLCALDLETRDRLWAFESGSSNLYAPAVAERVICIGGFDTPFYALEIDTGRALRTLETGDTKYRSSPIIAGDTVYLGGQGLLQAIDLNTGRELWQFTTPIPENPLLEPQFWMNKLAQQVLTTLTGASFSTEQFSTPIIYRGVIYVGCRNGYIYALD